MTAAREIFQGMGHGGRQSDPRVQATVKALKGQGFLVDLDDTEPLWKKAALIVEVVLNVDRNMKERSRRKHERL